MTLNILFSARAELWPAYKPALENACAERGLDINLVQETDAPETMDYMVYAPLNDDDDLSVFTNLKLIQSMWAGPDKLVKNQTLTQPLARMADTGMVDGMVDFVMGHILLHHLSTLHFIRADAGDWKAHLTSPLAKDRVVAFLGIGALGMACAKAAKAHGFEVLGWSRTQKDETAFPCFAGADGLTEVLSRADIVVTLMPATPETQKIIGKEMLSQMKWGVCLINPGRGDLVDDDALLEALNSGHVGAATLDVFTVEPLPKDSPYWTHPNVIVTPHVASETRVDTACAVAAENFARVERGEAPLYLVDPDLKY